MANPRLNKRNIYIFHPLSKAYFDFFTIMPSIKHRIIIDKFISRPLVNTGISSTLDRFWLPATEVEQNGTISVLNPSSTALTLVNTPTWVQYQGWTGNGTTQYVDTNYNPATNGVYFVQDNGSHGVYIRTNTAAGDKIEMGHRNLLAKFSNITARYTGDIISCPVNSDLTGIIGGANTDARGLISGVRTVSTSYSSYKNGALVDTDTANSVALFSANYYVFCRNTDGVATSFSDRQISAAFVGAGSINQLMMYNIIQGYMTALGTQI